MGLKRRGRSSLQRKFAEFNARYFEGQLPRFRVVRSGNLTRGVQGYGYHVVAGIPFAVGPRPFDQLDLAGICLEEKHLIRIADDLPADSESEVLLHEMCHIGTRGHGPDFCRKLMALADQGEDWAHDEADEFLGEYEQEEEQRCESDKIQIRDRAH